MKLINSKVEILEPTGYTIDDIYKQIEIAGRTCYKSEDKITPTSAKEFVDRIIKSGHGAMLEHGTVYLDMPNSAGNYNLVPFFASNPYSKVVIKSLDDRVHNCITTNFRVIVENFAEEYIPDVLQYICEPTEFHEKRISVRWTCDRGVSHEFVRHRVFSFAQESTRYVNYSKDKFGHEITYIQPCWEMQKDEEELFLLQLEQAQNAYNALISSGWRPQQARAILPNALKTELVMTGFESDWKHFFELRCDTAAHPDARKLALELYNKLYNKEYGKE